MNLEAFENVATAAGYKLYISLAGPFGGWEKPRLLANARIDLGDAVLGNLSAGEELTRAEYRDAVDAGILEELQVGVLIACDSDGNVFGAWNEIAWFLGSRQISIDWAYERIFAG